MLYCTLPYHVGRSPAPEQPDCHNLRRRLEVGFASPTTPAAAAPASAAAAVAAAASTATLSAAAAALRFGVAAFLLLGAVFDTLLPCPAAAAAHEQMGHFDASCCLAGQYCGQQQVLQGSFE